VNSTDSQQRQQTGFWSGSLASDALKRPDNDLVPDVVVMGHGTQAEALRVHHARSLLLLMACKLGLGPKPDPAFSGLGPATIGARQDAGTLVLRQSGQKREDALAERGREIEPLPVQRLQRRAAGCLADRVSARRGPKGSRPG
jgi:hypothetical protein